MMKKFFLLSVFVFVTLSFLNAQTAEIHWVDSVYNSLTLEQRVGQLINIRDNAKSASLIKKYNIGGVTFFKGDIKTQVDKTIEYQSVAKTPLMITIDAEWGLGMRLTDGFSYPFQITLGALQNDSLIAEMARQIADQCHRLGIHSTFSPVVDVNCEPKNPVIGVRSFGENPQKVAQKAWIYASTLQNNGILPTMKHFPGHGDTHLDSHIALPVVNKQKEKLDKTEFLPFKYLINKGVRGVMVAHISFPKLDKSERPASLSYLITNDLLRKEFGFKGLAFTDGLEMKGVQKHCTPDSIAFQALMAGNDVLLLPVNVEKSIKIIVDAAKNDPKVMKRVEESCRRVLTEKYRLGINKKQEISTQNLYKDLHNQRFIDLKQEIFNQAATLLTTNDKFFPLKKEMSIAVVSNYQSDKTANMLKIKGFNSAKIPFPNKKNLKNFKQQLDTFDVVVVNIRNTSISANKNFGINDDIVEVVTELSKRNNVIVNLFACPYALDFLKFKKKPAAILVLYQDNKLVENTAVSLLSGEIRPQGLLPVGTKNFSEGSGIVKKEQKSLKISEKPLQNEHVIDSMIEQALRDEAFPGCQVMAIKKGKIVYDKCFGFLDYSGKQKVDESTLYDIASMTKIFASTLAIMKLYEDGKVDLNATLGSYFPYLKGTNKENITLLEIMTHQAGLLPGYPYMTEFETSETLDENYFSSVIDEEHTVPVARDLYARNDVFSIMMKYFINTPLRDKKYCYSDMGFMLLPKVVELTTGVPFETYLEETFYRPMGLTDIMFHAGRKVDAGRVAPTADVILRHQVLQGYVHDPTAALMGGVAGHAGLFANAHSLAPLCQMLLDKGMYNGKKYLKEETIKYFTTRPFADNDNRRAIGFDKPNIDKTLNFTTPSLRASDTSYGHTGFTGTMFWIDPQNQLVFIFLANRIHPNEKNTKLSDSNLRTNIHDVLYE